MSTASPSRPRVAVVGGGLAGLSAAIACLDGGAAVTLFEARPRLGGATWSFTRNGLDFDNGQHVYLRCCTAYQRFLERVGTAHLAPLQDRLAIPVIAPGRGEGAAPVVSWLRRDPLPAPLHLARSLLGYRHLGLGDRLRLGQAALALRRLRLDDATLDDEDLASFLGRHGQREAAISALWELIALPTTNVHARQCSLALAAKVFKTGLLLDATAADVGWAHVPLARLHAEPAEQLLLRHGAVVRRRARVGELLLDDTGTGDAPGSGDAPGTGDKWDTGEAAGTGRRLRGVRCGGEAIEADAVVLAVPHTAAAELLPAGSLPGALRLAELGVSPIIDVNVVYDRRVTEHVLAAGVNSPVQFVFDRTSSAGLDPAAGQVLAVSVSGADEEHGERPEALIERYVAALAALFPAAREAKVVDAVVTREHEATFRGTPGTQCLRPGTSTGIANLFLAGAWTDTGWPATMEGAVRSGNRAAAWALSHLAGRVRQAPIAAGSAATGSRASAGDLPATGSRASAGDLSATEDSDRSLAGAARQHVRLAATLGGTQR